MTIFTKQSILIAVIMAVFCLGLFPAEAGARSGQAELEDIVVTNTKDSLLVYFTVTNCFTDDMVRAVQNGIPTSFLFFVELYEKRTFWRDIEVESHAITHEIKYDNLRKVYIVRRSDGEDHVTMVNDFDDAKRLMTEIVGFKLADLSSLEKGKTYRVALMAQMDKVELPLGLHYIFLFVRLWDFKTQWYNIEFIY